MRNAADPAYDTPEDMSSLAGGPLGSLELIETFYATHEIGEREMDRYKATLRERGWTSLNIGCEYQTIGYPYRYEAWGERRQP